MCKNDLRHIVITDDHYNKTTKNQMKKAKKWLNKTVNKRLNSDVPVIIILLSRLHLDDEQSYIFD